jgi:translation initiation factor 4E
VSVVIVQVQAWESLTEHATRSSKLNLSTNTSSTDLHDASSAKRFGSGVSKSTNYSSLASPSTLSVASPTSKGGSSPFGLGNGAFGFSSASKTPKTPGGASEKAGSDKKDSSDDASSRGGDKRLTGNKSLSSIRQPTTAAAAGAESPTSLAGRDPSQPWLLRHPWIIYYRPPTSKNSDYEKSIRPLCRITTAQEFWKVYSHLRRPSDLPTVSDYHFFKEGIRPVWEDEENRRGGKWTMRVKKGVADRYWEGLLLAMIGDQFIEASDEVCGAVVSMRSGEDVFSIWTKNDGGRNVKIRETIKRELHLPADTLLLWRSHDESIVQKQEVDRARQEKVAAGGAGAGADKRRNTVNNKGDGGGGTVR